MRKKWAYKLTERAWWKAIWLKNHGEQTVRVQWSLCKLNQAKYFPVCSTKLCEVFFSYIFLGSFQYAFLFMDVVNGFTHVQADCVNWYYTGLLSVTSSSLAGHLAQMQTSRECISRAVSWYYKECVCERKIILTWTVVLHYNFCSSLCKHTILNLQYLWHQP